MFKTYEIKHYSKKRFGTYSKRNIAIDITRLKKN